MDKEMRFTEEEMNGIQKYLILCVTNNKKCKTCKCRASYLLDDTKSICAFSAGCFLNSQSLYVENKKLSAG